MKIMKGDFDLKKLINVIAFFYENTDSTKLGILKLNKLLYHLDFEHYKKYGRPVIGDFYMKRKLGPVPTFTYTNLNLAFEECSNDPISRKIRDAMEIGPAQKVYDHEIKPIKSKKKFNNKFVSRSELEILSHIATKYYSDRGTKMSNEIHEDMNSPWNKSEYGCVIDYDLVLRNDDTSVSKDYVNYWKQQDKELKALL